MKISIRIYVRNRANVMLIGVYHINVSKLCVASLIGVWVCRGKWAFAANRPGKWKSASDRLCGDRARRHRNSKAEMSKAATLASISISASRKGSGPPTG